MSVYCTICCDSFKSENLPQLRPIALNDCHHVFHESCIEKYFRSISAKKCPVCRAILKEDGNHKTVLHFMYSPSPVFDNLMKEINELKNEKVKLLKQSADELGKVHLENYRLRLKLASDKEEFKKFKKEIQNATSEVMKVCKDASKLM